ncbi:MAG: DUF2156 domain-containing protein [Candidatus Aminicenantales bacterium]
MNLPSFPEFRPVGLEAKEAINDFIRRFPPQICEINFPNIFIWRNYEFPQLTTINGNLCILCQPPGEPAYFLPPLGETQLRETLEICLDFSPRLARVPEAFVEKYCAGLELEPDRDNFDYVYLVSDLIHLQGKKYDGKRNRIRKFGRSHTYRYFSLSVEHLENCLQLLDRWMQEKADQAPPVGEHQKTAILEALAHFEDLGLIGGGIEIEGKLEAFSIGSPLNPTTAVIHIEIVNPAYDGLSQLINREFVRRAWARFEFINREQDLGLPGLRRAKMSYHPHHLVKKYNVWRRSSRS